MEELELLKFLFESLSKAARLLLRRKRRNFVKREERVRNNRASSNKLTWISRRTASPHIGSFFLNLFGLLRRDDPETLALRKASERRQIELSKALKKHVVPRFMQERLAASRDGRSPWIATLRPAELLMIRSHGIRPIAAVSATCWMHYGNSWTSGHAEGWKRALRRIKEEARAAGANAVVDVQMRTLPLDAGDSMDFSLVGTAVRIEGLPPSDDPIIATVPALEFVRLLEADIVPTGIAIGAKHQWVSDYRVSRLKLFWAGNTECKALSDLWKKVRHGAYYLLRQNVGELGNGALAHVHFSQIFERDKGFMARYIMIATTVDVPEVSPLVKERAKQVSWWSARVASYVDRKEIKVPRASGQAFAQHLSAAKPMPLDFRLVVDMRAKTPLIGNVRHHQSYALNAEERGV